ncbi:MAG TPA: pilus assembly PilX N-terminal domain-containing protein, partial [Candidatus Acidoferrales bacterium]
ILISGIVVGMCWMVMTDQRLGGNNHDREAAFYGAEAGMEKLTADVGTTFAVKGALAAADITAITAAPPTTIPGVQYLNGVGASSYQITPLVPVASNATILPPSPYAGMQALITPFTLTVGARTPDGAEVKLQREVQAVAIPVFQFGVYSDSDVAYFNGPSFQFGGRVHTNGNLWLSPNSGPLFLGDKVTAVGQVIRTNLENGYTANGTSYTGDVSIAVSPDPSLTNEPTGSPYTNAQWRQLQLGEGSTSPTSTSSYAHISTTTNVAWPGGSGGVYNGQVQNGVPTLSLTATALGGITTPISLIRRAVPGELASNPSEFNEQYFSEATLRILLDDYPTGVTPGLANNASCQNADMMSLDTVTSTYPVDLATLAFPSATWASAIPPSWYTGASNVPSGALFPLPVSGAIGGTTYSSLDGYWLKSSGTSNGKPYPTILGCIKIEYQNLAGAWTDVTTTILNMGFTGRDIAPTGAGYKGSDGSTVITYVDPLAPNANVKLPTLPTGSAVGFPAQGPSPAGTAPATIPANCTDPSPSAIIRLARVRDNPSYDAGDCATAISKTNFIATDFWPMALFDTREGIFRPDDTTPGVVTAGGVMYYIELDAKNLAAWLSSKQSSLSLNNNTGGFTVYFSDRRGEQLDPNAGNTKTGSYGYNDFVNLNDATNGCPNGIIDPAVIPSGPSQGEDLEGDGLLRTYGGQESTQVPAADFVTNAGPSLWNGTFMNIVLASNTKCGGSHPNRPDVTYVDPQEARENPPVFFRRALKIVDGATLNLGTSCGAVPCGLTIAAENPVYIQGDYNAPVDTGTWAGASVAAAVAGDAVTFLSNNWNDANTFLFPQHIVSGKVRNAVPTAYRAAIISGKGIPFANSLTMPDGSLDFGTDGGVHNFLRFLEYWGVNCYYRGSLVSFYYNRQAVGTYKGSGVYSPPNRLYSFDQNFTLGPAYLPPRTPVLRSVNTIGFSQQILPTQ